MQVDGHQGRVRRVAQQVREHFERRQPVHITKGGEHHVVPLPGDRRFVNRPVDISALDRVLEIDPQKRRCVCEPGVSFRRLVEATLEHGLIPKVVPELEGITVGGAVAGCSIEAMSYRHGGFHDSCLEYEVIAGDGSLVRCGPDREPLLFGMLHGSYGTLGILGRVTFELVPAGPFVHMEYRHLPTLEAFWQELEQRCAAGDYELIDGIIHSPRQFTLCLGRFVEWAPYVSDYRREAIFYRSAARLQEDYLSTVDYCFRYDTECHWLTRTVPPLQWRPVRRAVGRWFLGSSNLIRWSNRLSRVLALKRRPDVVCDVFIPRDRFAEFYRWYERDFDFFPLWIVPYRMPGVYPWVAQEHGRALRQDAPGDLVIDCAVYGKPNNRPHVDYSRLLEDKTFELNGIKTLISRNHYSEERFWQIYNRPNYEAAKARLDPAGIFPDLYQTFGRVE
jgi:FAD/FMN-containing dehydrogenase